MGGSNGFTPEGAGGAAEYLAMVGRHHSRPWRVGPERDMEVSFAEFRQQVRKHRPSELLPAIAELAVAGGERPPKGQLLSSLPPWGLALIARESILWGNEHRDAPVTGDSLRRLINTHNDLYTSDFDSDDQDWALDTMIRLAFEQFPYQESIFEEVARPHALMVEGARHTAELEVLNSDAWVEILGAPLGEIVGATFLLQVGANVNNGWFDPAWLDLDDLQRVYDRWSRPVVDMRARDLSADFIGFRRAYDAVPHPPTGYERYAYNPLTRRPFLRMPNQRLLAPQPRLILRTVSPGALYYAGVERYGTAFTRDMGRLTERYVGALLTENQDLKVSGEVTYVDRRQQVKSIDWFLVLPGLVILFEVKSARFGLLERAAFGDYRAKMTTLLNKAIKQLTRTSDAIDASHLAFAHIPADKPRVGIVVTGEPHYLANSPWVRNMLDAAPIPTLTASLREVEALTTLPPDQIETQLLAIATDPDRSTWNLSNALEGAHGRTHPVLRRAWDAYPWPDGLNESR